MPHACELKPRDLKRTCDPKQFSFRNTSQIDPLESVIGQKRAVQAIDFGLNMNSPGYNIFVTGFEGTGKSTIVKDIVSKHADKRSTPVDWCMVNNFQDEFCPRVLSLPPGEAHIFKRLIMNFIDDLKTELPKAFERKSYKKQQSALVQKFSDKQHSQFKALEASAKQMNVKIKRTQSGFQTLPLIKGEPMTPEQYEALPKKGRQKLDANLTNLQQQIESTMLEISKLNFERQEAVDTLMSEVTLFIVKSRINVIQNRYKGWDNLLAYLDEIQANIIENVIAFLPDTQQGQPETPIESSSQPLAPFNPYDVNVLVDRKGTHGAAVIFETNPTYQNLFGHVEKRAYMGTLMTDYTMVQAGSLLRANGGYLILEVDSVLRQPLVWESLKRALQNKHLAIEDLPAGVGFGTTSLRPQPINLEVKVILLGSYQLFQLLQNSDSKFNKIFKVRADFDQQVDCTPETIQQYARFIARMGKEDHLLPVTAVGVAAVVEFGMRQIADKHKLSLRFGVVQDLLKEADYWARKKGAKSISAKQINRALKEHDFRYNLYEQKIHESYLDGTILIDVEGKQTGQVNALAVYQIGELAFGRPSRITAETYMGKSGVINIERESGLSGRTHDKGILILSGFLGRTFAQSAPLNLSASITFEQNYGGIDGDSASSTELYAILSSLSKLPLAQGIAVTGSVNQKGDIQAIGGVNEKVEGFFDVCCAKGLTGSQGVIIPAANVKNLMVKDDVIQAIRRHQFHIYSVSRIEEGIEILTGIAAGSLDSDGKYPQGTVFGKIQLQLAAYTRRYQQMRRPLASTKATTKR